MIASITFLFPFLFFSVSVVVDCMLVVVVVCLDFQRSLAGKGNHVLW